MEALMNVESKSLGHQDHSSASSVVFMILVGFAALFIAGCSAYFSVQGLGLLFVGSATAVMVMAASLELGKLVAASFLYRYWQDIGVAMRFYLLSAVILLVAITSLGNYGYLARAYERTNSQISVLEEQIASIQQEIDDTQRQIDGSKQQFSRSSEIDRKDIDQVQQRIAHANQSLDQSLRRIEERRNAAKDKRTRDADLIKAQMADHAAVLKQGLDSEDAAVGQLNERIAVLDRAVDAYTSQGGPGFLKADGIRRGQVLREQQQAERDSIAAKIAARQQAQEQLRAEYAKTVETINLQLAGVEDQYRKDLSAFNLEEKSLRKSRDDDVALAEAQLKSMQAQNQSSSLQGGSQIDGLYQRIRTGNNEILRLREEIAATDIGSYRFVARAFNAGADDVVKWLILVLVLVFDPLAVTLTVGFSIMTMRGRRPRVVSEPETKPASVFPRRALLSGGAIAITCLVVVAGSAAYYGVGVLRTGPASAHSQWIPADSFAVVRIDPGQLKSGVGEQRLVSLLGAEAAKSMIAALTDLLASGFDRDAAIYAFAKFPSTPASANSGDRPVMLFGLVARVSDPRTAEVGLSRFSDVVSASLGLASTEEGGNARSRSMVKYGRGRYLDPDGGFFTFGIAEDAAIVLLEVEGDPKHPSVGNEIRLCLATPSSESQSFGKARAKLPSRATSSDGAVSIWFDASRCFTQMPKNPAAQSRFVQLQRHIGFNLLMTMNPTQDDFELTADYAYTIDRFNGGSQPSAIETLRRLGPAEPAGIPGQLMDRCATTLDFDGLNESLRLLFAKPQAGAIPAQVLIEKSIASDRDGRFVLTARYDAEAGTRLLASKESLTR